MSKSLNVVVLLGGPSAERDVSLRSGAAVAGALESLGHRITRIDPQPGALEVPADTDVVFIALHGTYGEDGDVQAVLEAMDIPYTGCDAPSSRLAFDKLLTKQRLLERGINTPRYCVVKRPDASWPAGFRPPLVVKPVRQGSSVGLAFVDAENGWTEALRTGFAHGDEMLVEERILGREVTVGVLAGEPLPIVEVRPKAGAYDYTNKYTVGKTEYLCPAPFSNEVTRQIQQAGFGAFLSVGGRDYGRVDVMVSRENVPFVLEVNTLPGMTETSLLPKAAAAAGLTYEQLCQRMIDLALRRQAAPAT